MLDIEPQHLKLVKEILAQYVVGCDVWAFGSRVRGTSVNYSDLDIVVIAKEKIERRILNRLQEAFEDSELPFRVDVIDWYRISASFQKLIQQKYEIIQEAGN